MYIPSLISDIFGNYYLCDNFNGLSHLQDTDQVPVEVFSFLVLVQYAWTKWI